MADDAYAVLPRPLAPDFAPHPIGPALPDLSIEGDFLVAAWPDGTRARFHALWLRENEVREGVIDDVTRERECEIDRFPADTTIASAELAEGPSVLITWGPNGSTGRVDPGWLRSMAQGLWKPDTDIPAQLPWETAEMPEPPTFDGPAVLTDDATLAYFVMATWTRGFARLRNLPIEPGTVQLVGERIGTVR